jgi:LytS/YehU family sensor histidine kinase
VPRLAEPDEVPEEARPAVNGLLAQAAVRLENLKLQDEQARAERRAAELREAATRAELRALHAQVQPHFVFNALNALSYLIETDPAAAQRYAERLADMLRYTVAAGERPAALLGEEISFVEDFLAVARERYENPLSFEYRGPEDMLGVAVPPLLLQPLVENSLKHGIAQDLSPLHLSLEAERREDRLELVFRDDGVSESNGRAPGSRTGLANLEQRLRRFAGADATLTARAANGGGFEVRLQWKVNGGGPLSPATKGSS